MARQQNNRYPNADVTDWVLVNNKRKPVNRLGKETTIPKQRVTSKEVGVVLNVARILRKQGIFTTAVRA